MKLTTTTHVSVDGVMQGLGGRDEDRRGGFERGGWALPLFDDEAATFVYEVYERADGFLFGRRTYEIFASYWGVIADSGNPIAAALNTRPKYLASTTLTEPRWADTTVLSGDVAAAIRELKAKPMVIGQRTRLFPDTGPDAALDLVDSRATPKGVTIQVYRPTGRRPQYARASAD
jgi:dihydrofolate reductase